MYWKFIVSRRFPTGTPVEFTGNDSKIRQGEVIAYVPALKLRIRSVDGEYVVKHTKAKKVE